MKGLARSMARVAAAGLAIRQHPDAHSGARIDPEHVPTALRAFWADGFFAAASEAFILSYLGLLAHELGASATQIGLLTAAQSLGSMLALYPGALAARRANSRRWMVVFYAGTLGRLTLFLSALAVAFLHGQTALYVLVALLTARAFLGSFTVPAWTSLAADIIPQPLRAKYFASRNFAISSATLVITPLGGILLDRWGFPGGFVVALLVSFVLGMGATIAYRLIPEPAARGAATLAAPPHPSLIFRNARFRTFVIATFSLHFATMIAGPFFNVYLVDGLGGSNFDVGWLTTASALTGLIGQLVFGEMMARRGSLWLSRVALLTLPLLPLMWVGITEPWMVLAPNLIGGAMWAAFNLANFQQLLETTPEDEREQYVAAFHMCVFLALFIAPFVGGVIVDTLGYKAAFLVSGFGRLVPAFMFFFVIKKGREPGFPTGEGFSPATRNG